MGRELPLLLSSAYVRATIARRKSQTRRVIRPDWSRCLDLDDPDDIKQAIAHCPYGAPGDKLWVREAWKQDFVRNHVDYTALGILYRADNTGINMDLTDRAQRDQALKGMKHGSNWRPSIHMPKIYSRIKLLVKKIRVERVQQISADDAIAEGVILQPSSETWAELNPTTRELYYKIALETFMREWDRLNKSRGYGWGQNPHVFVVEYSVDEVLVSSKSH